MIRDWVFDLDNTLYPAPTLYEEIGARMTAFIVRALKTDEASALALRERYFHQYGATVCGLVTHHGVDAKAFLSYVHDADHSVLARDPELAMLLQRLPGRKLVFTNGGGGHAQRTLESLGLAQFFERVFDIEDALLTPKPQNGAYARLIETCGIDPPRAILVEDTLKNLEPAHALGFRTALVGATHPDSHIAYVDHWAPDVVTLLRRWLDGGG